LEANDGREAVAARKAIIAFQSLSRMMAMPSMADRR
jgi:hypothetical protein